MPPPDDTAAARIDALRSLAARTPGDHLTWFMLGRELTKAERFDEAADALGQCLALAPDYTAAYRFRGDALRRAGRPAEARAVYTEGIAVSERTGDLQAGREMRALADKLPPA